jgi:hypothetical protein
MSILENTKIMPKTQRTNLTNHSQTQIYNNLNINSYVIANRTHSNQMQTVDLYSKDNNDAIIHSDSMTTQNEFSQENVFYNVDKLTIDKLAILTNSESLVKSTGYLNCLYTPIFNAKEVNSYKEYKKNETIYPEEVDNLKIEWKRLSVNKTIKLPNFKHISQGSANNCSVIAAIIAILNYDEKFEKKTLSNIFYPYKVKSYLIKDMLPMFNKDGNYKLKLFFNGNARVLETDDLFPFHKSNPMFANGENMYWINLLEKAIFQLYNSESFMLKSNPSYEIYHLIGWIPEIILFDSISNKDNLWYRLLSNYTEGNILLCIGTRNKDFINQELSSNYTINKSNLVNDHSYAVLEIFEEGELKLIKCKNPWGHTIPNIIHDKTTEEDKEYGCFWIEWDNIVKHYSYLFIAWNSESYPYKYNITSSWKNYNSASKFYDESYSLEYNPQYIITVPEHKEDFEIRIVLSRYSKTISNKTRKSISYKLFWFEGYPIIYPTEHLRTLQNPCREISSDVFVFSASSQVDQFALVILKQDQEEEDDTTFILELFSFINITIHEMPKREIIVNNTLRFIDNWNLTKPSGNLLSPNLIFNPQYKLSLKSIQHIQIKLETNLTTPIMIIVIEGGRYIGRLSFDEIINNKNPGFYFNSFSYFESILDQGEYTIICVSQEERMVIINYKSR